jgi:hypothetical protein
MIPLKMIYLLKMQRFSIQRLINLELEGIPAGLSLKGKEYYRRKI